MILPIFLIIASIGMSAQPLEGAITTDVPVNSKPETMTAYVKEYFADDPILADIAWCESRMRQLGPEGEVIRGKANKYDIGVMQINTLYHEERAEEMGLDLHSLSGNLAYGKYLYETQGTKPWRASEPCWGKLAGK